MTTWHRIEDGLPERSGQYIVLYASRLKTVEWCLDRVWLAEPCIVEHFTHWHELPEDPE